MDNREPYLNDKYREHYAVVAKHLICQPSKISLFQLERFALSKSQMISYATAGLGYVWDNVIYKKINQIGNVIVSQLGIALTGGIGLATAVAIGGFLYVYDTKQTEASEGILIQCFAKSKISQIKAYLSAYESCFSNLNKVESYCKQIQSPFYLTKLLTHLNEIFAIIINEPQKMKLDQQLEVCGLFYKIAKIAIHLHCLINFNSLAEELQNLKKMHKQIKKLMNIRIQNRIEFGQSNAIFITNVFGEKIFLFCDEHSIVSLDQFSTEIFDVIFRCPFTKLLIEELFNQYFWTKTPTNDIDIQKKISQTGQRVCIGLQLQNYQKVIQHQSARVKNIIYSQRQKRWAGEYQSLKEKAIFHFQDFQKGKEQMEMDKITAQPTKKIIGFPYQDFKLCQRRVEFDKVKALFICRQQLGQYTPFNFAWYTCLRAVTRQHRIINVHHFLSQQKIQIAQKISFCIQFDGFSYIKTIKSNGVLNLKFQLEPKSSQRQYGPFSGFIATLDRTHRLSYGTRSLVNWAKGYTFRLKNETQKSQQLIFEAITEVSFFDKQSSKELSQFCCRITNEGDQGMYMVRHSRDKESGVFAGDSSGGQIVKVKLVEKLGKGEYKGHLFVITPQKQLCTAYLSQFKDLEWSKDEAKNKATQFYMRIKHSKAIFNNFIIL